MVLFRRRRINKLLDQHAVASPRERDRLHIELRDLIADGRSEALQLGDEHEFCEYSLWLGQLFVEGPDPSDALRPLACAYLIACLRGPSFKKLRSEAAEGLAIAYMRFGEFELAVECIIDIAQFGGTFTHLGLGLVYPLLAEVHPESTKDIVGRFYEDAREDLLDVPDSDPLKSLSSVIDHRFGVVGHDYESLKRKTEALVAEGDETAVPAHRALAELALGEGRHREARGHAADAIRCAVVADRYPWMSTALNGLYARTLLATGEPDVALDRALLGWSATLPALLNCKDDFARNRLRWMANDCVDVAMAVACERRDWSLLTDFIENSRLQIARAATPDRDDQVVREFPDGLVRNVPRAIGQGACRAAVHAMGADWKIGKRVQVATTWQGHSKLVASVVAHGRSTADRITTIDAYDLLKDDVAGDSLVWFAAVRNNALFWSLADRSGAVDGGSVDLSRPALATSLAALRKSVQRDSEPNDPRDVLPSQHDDIHVAEALIAAGDPYEDELMSPLQALLPPRLRERALDRTEGNPLRVLFALPAELSSIPWPIVPLGSGLRLVERVELQMLTPSAIRATAPRPKLRTSVQPVALSCSNPDGALHAAPPVPGDLVLDGNSSGQVTLAQFETAIGAARWDQGSTLFVRSHLGSSSGAPYIADRGILFADGVLSARDLALTATGGGPKKALPNRVVLALCSGAAAGDTSGLTLGLAAACRLAGAEEVITSLFDTLDTPWGCKFDRRLARAASEPAPPPVTLRQLQLECLREWQQADVDDTTTWDGLPHPLIWASFVVVN